MDTHRLSVYQDALWGSRQIGVVIASEDEHGTLFVDGVRVDEVRRDNLFSVLCCADGSKHAVLSGFLRLAHGPARVRPPVIEQPAE